MNLIKPNKLKSGDTIGIIAPSGKIDNTKNLMRAKDFFEEHGYKVVLSEKLTEEKNYLAGDDKTRLNELEHFFADKKIDAIICLRGGYGAIRLIKEIDYDIIRQNPKIFCGYSDITAFLLMFLKNSRLITFHAPMIQGDFGTENRYEYTIDNFFKALQSDKLEFRGTKILNTGKANGILWGGNLTTVTSLCGQDFIPDENFIFFTEDVGEDAYKIDRMITQLFNIDKFKNNLKGIILGEFTNTDNEKWVDEIFEEIAKKYNIPVIGGFKITHGCEKITLPVGASAKIEDDKLILTEF